MFLPPEFGIMTPHSLPGRWSQLKSEVRDEWHMLTDEDLLAIDGSRDRLVQRITDRYGGTPEAVEAEVQTFLARLGHSG